MTETTVRARPRARVRLGRATVALPDRISSIAVWSALVAIVLLEFGAFRPVIVFPAIVVAVAATWRLTPSPVTVDTRSVAGALTATVGVAVWVVTNLPWTSRYVIATRDPGFLTLMAHWLAHHGTATIPNADATSVAASVADVSAHSGAFAAAGDTLQVQGANGLPAVLAVGSWLAGDRFALAGNLLIGGFALVALYAFGRRVVGPLWALLPVAALAMSMPMVAFSRAAYTEPLTMLLVVTGLTAGWDGWQTRKLRMLAVAGAAIGTTAMVRIDGAIYSVGLFAALAIIAVATRSATRPWLRRAIAAAGTPALTGVVLGWLDLKLNSPGYLTDLGPQWRPLFVLLAAVMGVAVLVAAIPSSWPAHTLLARRGTIARIAAAAVAIVGAVMASRPWWLVSRHLDPESGYGAVVATLQAYEGVAIDAGRSYDEMSLNWLTWYYGIPAVALALVGLALLTHHTIARRDPRTLLLLAVVGPVSLLYLWRVNITPDQVWAVRRFLPLTIPGFLLTAVWTLKAAVTLLRGRWRIGAAVVGGAALVMAPVLTWPPALATSVEQAGRLGELSAVCQAIGDDPVVFVATPDTPPYFGTLRVWCDVPVVETVGPATPERLQAVADAWGRPVRLVSFRSDVVPWTADPMPLRVTQTSRWDQGLLHAPTGTVDETSTVYVGTINPSGIEPSGFVVPDATP
jgi:4-amino-4-deoxy-L-arabinose transferase-like glycosyltransferase